MKKIGIIGAGVMGCDIIIDLAINNYEEVFIIDTSNELLEKAKEKIIENFNFYCFLKPTLRSFKIAELTEKFVFLTDLEILKDVDLVIENVTENETIKMQLFETLNQICRKDTLYAVNTSCISITKLSQQISNRENMIGTHFMNPVPLKNIVEVIRGTHTSEQTIASLQNFLSSLNKSCVVVEDFPGFVSNRLSHLFMNEAIFLIQDGVASSQDIDRLFRQGFGHKMGPLETADLIGLDTIMNSLEVLYENYQDSKFRCAPLLRKMVNSGWLGKKTGKGFYEY